MSLPAPAPVQSAAARLWARSLTREDEAFASFEFSQLARECHATYGAPDWGLRGSHGERKSESSSYLEWHEQNLRTIFRNVGAPWYGGTNPSAQGISETIDFAYRGGACRRVYLAPLDQAPAHLPRAEFGPCRMGRFSEDELAHIIKSVALNRHGHDRLDVASLSQFSWLSIDEQIILQPAAERDILFQLLNTKLDTDSKVIMRHRTFPAIVERVLFVLMLHPWEDFVRSSENWRPFHMPWVHPVNSDPLEPATPPQDAESLSWQLDAYPTPDGDLIELDRPVTRRMKNEAFDDFQAKLSQTWRALQLVYPLVQPSSSPFNRLVEHFLLRGYLEKGIDELIMHMTGVDAAVGSRHYRKVTKYKSMTDAIAGRLKRLLQDEAAATEFERLYDVRSAYIHGRDQDGAILTSDLISARAHEPGFPVRTITTSPGDNADFRSRRWNSSEMCFRSVSLIRSGSTF
jgi:hypothetical protein